MRRLIGVLAVFTVAADWAEFRGPNGTGLYTGPKLVTEWGPEKNVAWKTELPGKAWSSPVVSSGVVYLTTAVPSADGQSLRTLAVDAASGAVRWNVEVFNVPAKRAGAQHAKNSYASPTPVVVVDRVYVHFGHMGTACLDTAGKIVWSTQEFNYVPVHGTGGSPIVSGNLLVFSVDGGDQQFVLALDRGTGKTLWKTDRKSKASRTFSFTTPLEITVGGAKQIVSAASDFVAGYDPTSGAEVWRANYPKGGYSLISRPVLVGGLVVIQTGYNTPYLFALDPTGTGDITNKIVWSTTKGAPHTPSPVVVGDEVYAVSDKGLMTCYDGKTGTVYWSERLKGNGYSASPIVADGLLYVTSEEGLGQVVKAGKTFEPVSESAMGAKTFATFAAVDGALFVRTETALFRFAPK